MHGLIVKEPFATQLVKGKKLTEFRSKPLPKHLIDEKVFILNSGRVLGTVIFCDQTKHDDKNYSWYVLESKEFSPYMKYKHKNGCIIWIKDVEVFE